MDVDAFHFERRARSPRAIFFIALWWAAIALLHFAIQANPWILLLLALVSLPAIYDLGANASAILTIDAQQIAWRSGQRGATFPRAQLQKVRLDTRLDFSLRMTLIPHQGRKIRLPYECVPAAAEIETALTAHGIPFERHHFTLLS